MPSAVRPLIKKERGATTGLIARCAHGGERGDEESVHVLTPSAVRRTGKVPSPDQSLHPVSRKTEKSCLTLSEELKKSLHPISQTRTPKVTSPLSAERLKKLLNLVRSIEKVLSSDQSNKSPQKSLHPVSRKTEKAA